MTHAAGGPAPCGWLAFDDAGRILEANEALLDMLGYSREDLIAGRLRWTKLTPPEWAAADQDALAQLSATGTCRPFSSNAPPTIGSQYWPTNGPTPTNMPSKYRCR